MQYENMPTAGALRRLSLEEAQLEFPDNAPPWSTWSELSTEDLKMVLIPISLHLLWKGEEGKCKALVKLLQAISDAENEDPQREVQSAQFFETSGIDNLKFPDEHPNLPPEERLVQALFGRKQRPLFYFEVEELAGFLKESRATEFRRAV